MRLELPLVGLLEECLLPGEERAFTPPAVEGAAIDAARVAQTPRVCALAVASQVELPGMVSGRWGTEAVVIVCEAERIVLRGERRVRILSAAGDAGHFTAEVDAAPEAPLNADLPALLAAGHTLLAALNVADLPDLPDWRARVRQAVFDLLRTVAGPDEIREALRIPPGEAIEGIARAFAARAAGHRAACTLESSLREMMAKPDLPPALRTRLWSQVVEIMKRLDLAEPTTAGPAAEEDDGLQSLQKRLQQAGLPKGARDTAKRNLRNLRGMRKDHHDYPTYFAHLDFMARLPWRPPTPRPIDLPAVQAALDRTHAGLDKAKRRILEYLAVRELGGSARSVVLCLAGPPGVGKTTVARAIAEALGRAFVRVPLGGVHDEAEIRGHRITYLAAQPGRLLSGIARAGASDAVVLLDEIDKLGTDALRSPMGALLEALDPEQNREFQDNFLGVPYDLSHALFLCTANELGPVHYTLRDRLEAIELDGYTASEKVAIVRGHLLERLREEHGLPVPLTIADDALALILEGYTAEAGVRELHRVLASIHRARALALFLARTASTGGASAPGAPITADEVHAVLGAPRHLVQARPLRLPVGVSTGLSVGPAGGALIFIEVARMPGKGELRLTGRLGEVMREAAMTAFSHLRMAPARHGLEARLLEGDFHVHVPEAATAKDGPSAGAALVCAFVSAVTGVALPADIAMTGEITLNGGILPVGGVRAKALAAERAGMRRVVIPEGNRADVPADLRIPPVFVSDVDEVIRLVFPAGAVPQGVAHVAASALPRDR